MPANWMPTASPNFRIARRQPKNRPMLSWRSAVLRAEFRHLPWAYHVIAMPNASNRSVFTLRPLGDRSAHCNNGKFHGIPRGSFVLEF
jgi:hypothetical protein